MKLAPSPTVLLILALSLGGCQKPLQDAFGEQVRAYLLSHTEVLEETAQKLQEKKAEKASFEVKSGLKAQRAALEADSRDLVINPSGKITLVEFFDYRCGYCKLAAPEVMKIANENPNIRIVFKEFPIFGGVSNLAAQIALTPAGKAHGFNLYKGFMSEKALDNTAIERILRSEGLNPAEVFKAASEAGITKQLEDTHALAQALNIEGTPAFIIGDHLIPGADISALRAAIAEAQSGPLKRPT